MVHQSTQNPRTHFKTPRKVAYICIYLKTITIKLIPCFKGLNHSRQPYPLNWEEQERLFNMLPAHLRRMALFAVNTGCRDREICLLRWGWEVKIPELNASVFIIPGRIKIELSLDVGADTVR